MNSEWVGWICSVVLILTMLAQVAKEWATPKPKGVSRWLYRGQLGAEAGFVYYSWAVGNWVFVVTNTLLFLINLAGVIVHAVRKDAPTGRDA